MTVTVEYAAQHLEELLENLEQGDRVEIVRPSKGPLLLSVDAVGSAGSKRILGAGKAFSKLPSEEELERIQEPCGSVT
jgi:hypothetical protein